MHGQQICSNSKTPCDYFSTHNLYQIILQVHNSDHHSVCFGTVDARHVSHRYSRSVRYKEPSVSKTLVWKAVWGKLRWKVIFNERDVSLSPFSLGFPKEALRHSTRYALYVKNSTVCSLFLLHAKLNPFSRLCGALPYSQSHLFNSEPVRNYIGSELLPWQPFTPIR